MKKTYKIIISTVIITAMLITTVYFGCYAYWGRRHRILYDVETVYMTQVEGGYEFKIIAEAKNWKIDNNTYKFSLEADVRGMPDYYWDGNSNYITVTNHDSTKFEINGFLETSSTDPETVKDQMFSTRYSPDDYNLDSATLYMEDFTDTEIIFN